MSGQKLGPKQGAKLLPTGKMPPEIGPQIGGLLNFAAMFVLRLFKSLFYGQNNGCLVVPLCSLSRAFTGCRGCCPSLLLRKYGKAFVLPPRNRSTGETLVCTAFP